MMAIVNLRKEIDKVDAQIVDLLVRRFEVALKIAEEKKHIGKDVLDSSRESEVLAHIAEISPDVLKNANQEIFKEVMHQSCVLQKEKMKKC